MLTTMTNEKESGGTDEAIPHLNASAWDTYEKHELLGQGQFGDVYRGVHKETQEHVAVKVLKRGRVNMTAVNKEIAVYSRLARAPFNRGLNRLKEVYKDRSSREIYLILDLVLGGDLYDRVESAPYKEEAAQRLLAVLIEAIVGLHTSGVAHRDLKLENLLLRTPDDDIDCVIADLGYGKWFPQGASGITSTETGTPGYIAPEACSFRYGEKIEYDAYLVDVYALGVIMYIVLCGYPPWELSELRGGRAQREAERELNFRTTHPATKIWETISTQAQELLRKMLDPTPSSRISIEGIVQHAWVAPLLQQHVESAPVDQKKQWTFATTKCTEKSKLSVELWQNQHLMLTQCKWEPAKVEVSQRSAWTDHAGVQLSREPTREPPATLQLPRNWPASPPAMSQPVELLTVTGPGSWEYATSWELDCESDHKMWSSEQCWHSFVRRRKWVVQVAPLTGNAAVETATAMNIMEAEPSDMTPMVKTKPQVALEQPAVLSSPWSAVFAKALQGRTSTACTLAPSTPMATTNFNHFIGLTNTIRDSETSMEPETYMEP